ncbi:TlpA family protein disulfide reductase [Maribacter sp. 2308TA10-17]|uniref:TlpA family protein disulfide reductase n=1 Tax=Maribacter sp. 2308TA10-17 TaxID=3386276 RepID=UPI0039BCEC12
MRIKLAILFLAILIGSCQEESRTENAFTTIIGNMQSDEVESILFYSDTVFKVIPVESRKFKVMLPKNTNNSFWGVAAKFSRGYFYVPKGDTIHMDIDLENFNPSLYSNFKDPVNTYLKDKQMKLRARSIENIDSTQISFFLDSLSGILKQDYHNFLEKNKQLPSIVKEVESMNLTAELQQIDLSNKNMVGRKSPLKNEIVFSDNFMKSPKYLDLLDAARWSLPSQRIQEEGRDMNTMNIEEIISYQLEEINKIDQNQVKSYLMFRALRTQLMMKGVEGAKSNLDLFKSNNSIDNYSISIEEMVQKRRTITTGITASEFEYEDREGTIVKLSDFRGKYVLIDLWATWCKPCLIEMPYLKEIEKSMANKNIEFIAISIDQDKQKWKEYLTKHHFEGNQLIADKAEESSIMKDYKIMGLPNYLLIDDKGKIISVSAPKPSSGELKTLLEKEVE